MGELEVIWAQKSFLKVAKLAVFCTKLVIYIAKMAIITTSIIEVPSKDPK